MSENTPAPLANHTAIVTRVDSALGQIVALALAAAGAAVCANGLNPARVDRVVETITQAGGRALGWNGDMSNRFQVSALIEAARATFGGLQIVASIADVQRPGSVLHLDEYDWRRVLELNLTSSFFFVQLAGRVMAEAGGGTILVVTGIDAEAAPGSHAALASSAGGLAGLIHAAAQDLAASSVRVNLLRAGLLAETDSAPATPAAAALRTATVFLCSGHSAPLSGQVLDVAEAARRAQQV